MNTNPTEQGGEAREKLWLRLWVYVDQMILQYYEFNIYNNLEPKDFLTQVLHLFWRRVTLKLANFLQKPIQELDLFSALLFHLQ